MDNASPDIDANRFAPPRTHVEDVTTSATGHLAGRGARLGAALIDMVIAFGIAALGYPAFGWKFWAQAPGQSLPVMFAINLTVGFVAYVLVHGWLLHTRGQTVGKLIVGLRIVRSDGSRAGIARLLFTRYLLNTLFCIVPVVGSLYALVDCLLIFRASRKCVHDNLADTIVVKV